MGALALACVAAAACVLLGRWQWSRHEDRLVKANAVSRHYASEPVPLASVLPGPGAVLGADDQWTKVTTMARYDASAPLFARNRPNHGVYGYEVLAVAALPDGLLLVDRGWAPYTGDATTIPPVQPPPGGEVTLSGWLRSGEPDLDRTLPPGQLASINPAVAAEQLGARVYATYLVLDPAAPGGVTTSSGLAPLEEPDTDLGPHLAYAVQWWVLAPGGLILLWRLLRSEQRELAEADPALAHHVRPKKVHVWDEEDS